MPSNTETSHNGEKEIGERVLPVVQNDRTDFYFCGFPNLDSLQIDHIFPYSKNKKTGRKPIISMYTVVVTSDYSLHWGSDIL